MLCGYGLGLKVPKGSLVEAVSPAEGHHGGSEVGPRELRPGDGSGLMEPWGQQPPLPLSTVSCAPQVQSPGAQVPWTETSIPRT